MNTLTFADVEGAVRTWARAETGITAKVAGRVFFGIPVSPTFPLIVVSRVGGAPQAGADHPLEDPLLSFSVWGDSKGQAADAAAALATALANITSGTVLSGSIVCLGAGVVLWLWSPDPETDRARYVVDARLTVKVV